MIYVSSVTYIGVNVRIITSHKLLSKERKRSICVIMEVRLVNKCLQQVLPESDLQSHA